MRFAGVIGALPDPSGNRSVKCNVITRLASAKSVTSDTIDGHGKCGGWAGMNRTALCGGRIRLPRTSVR